MNEGNRKVILAILCLNKKQDRDIGSVKNVEDKLWKY